MYITFLIPCLIAIFLAINMGGSGTAPAFSAVYEANIVKRKMIPVLFGIAVFSGAIIFGKETAKTIGKELLAPEMMTIIIGSIILFSVAVSLMIANLFGIPQSTSQATVLSVIAPAIYFHSLNTNKLFYEILPIWFIMPIISFVLAYLIGKYIYRPLKRRGNTTPKILKENYFLKLLIVIMSLYVAFSIGTNNVANAVGPLATMMGNELNITDNNFIRIIILATLIVAPFFGIGSSFFGQKIVKKTGKEIVLFGKIEAVIIAFISASLLLTASLVNGIPTSLVQINVAAIIGIGVAKLGFKNIFRKTEVNKFFAMWIISPIIAFSVSLLLTYFADELHLLNL